MEVINALVRAISLEQLGRKPDRDGFKGEWRRFQDGD
jgi:hypothetical protein